MLGGLALALAVTLTLCVCLFAMSRTAAEAHRLTVVLDAGHGGVDGGVVGTRSGVKESDINLAIVLLLQEKFEEAGLGVTLTRRTEAGLYGAATSGYKRRDMQRRAEIIRSSSPSVVLSVHQNFFSLSSRRGAQVFFRESNPASVRLACELQSALNGMEECARRCNPLKGDYYVLNCSDYPSVIVECGFLSNPDDERLLLDGAYRGKLCEAIVRGTLAFLSSDADGIGG